MKTNLDLSILELHEKLKNKEIKPVDLVLEAYERIEKNKHLNCFITLCKEEAIRYAESLENQEVDNVLFGIPIAIKDNIITKDLVTTAGSKMLKDFVPIYDASVMELVHEKKMIVIGKLNMDEFAMGSTNRTSYFGAVLNPWNVEMVPGGSSGGAASAVSARLVPLALGSDTGGSIRQPSSFCGIVGLKPTYGRVSRYGLIAFASSLDQIGPMTRNVYENALLLNAICKKDEKDLTSVATFEDFTRNIGKDIRGKRFAIPSFYMGDVIDSEIRDCFSSLVAVLKDAGAIVCEVPMNYLSYAVPLYQIIALGEASSNLARYDGIKYGYATKDAQNIEEFYEKTRSEGFGVEVKRRLMIGSYLLSGPNAKTYYETALKIRTLIKKEFDSVFRSFDYVIGPTTTSVAYPLNQDRDNAIKSFADDILTIPVNMAGLPGLSLPIGFSSSHLPIGMQIIAPSFEEASIYQAAAFIEKKLDLDLEGGHHE